LILDDHFENFAKDIELIGKKLNSYINSIGKQFSVDLLQDGK